MRSLRTNAMHSISLVCLLVCDRIVPAVEIAGLQDINKFVFLSAALTMASHFIKLNNGHEIPALGLGGFPPSIYVI